MGWFCGEGGHWSLALRKRRRVGYFLLDIIGFVGRERERERGLVQSDGWVVTLLSCL